MQVVISAGIAALVGLSWLAKKAVPSKFVRALRAHRFPGFLRPLRGISEKGEWAG